MKKVIYVQVNDFILIAVMIAGIALSIWGCTAR